MGLCTLSDKYAVNGSSIYAPSEDGVKVEHNNIVSSDSGRTESGKMHIRWVRRDVRKVSLTYDAITGIEVKHMIDLMQGREFTFDYYDMGEMQSMSAYCGESSYTEHNLKNHAEEGGVYKNFSINVIEM